MMRKVGFHSSFLEQHYFFSIATLLFSSTDTRTDKVLFDLCCWNFHKFEFTRTCETSERVNEFTEDAGAKKKKERQTLTLARSRLLRCSWKAAGLFRAARMEAGRQRWRDENAAHTDCDKNRSATFKEQLCENRISYWGRRFLKQKWLWAQKVMGEFLSPHWKSREQCAGIKNKNKKSFAMKAATVT